MTIAFLYSFFCGLILTPIIVWIKHRVSPGGITDLINAVKGAPMQSYSCSVKVVSVQGEDFGATANLVYVDGGGIDISFAGETIAIQITEDAAEIVQTGALLTLTISKP